MNLLEKIKDKSKELDKTIVLPEGNDERIKKAGRIIETNNIAKTIILNGDQEDLKKACLMVKNGEADGMVAGAVNATAAVLRISLKHIGVRKDISIVSSFFIMSGKDENIGEKGSIVFADCAVNPKPNSEGLADIASSTVRSVRDVLNWTPRVAILSFSTKGSASHEAVDEVKKAVKILESRKENFIYEGELQADTALVPEIAKKKDKDSKLKGRANILIFPDLNSGNISYKLVQRLGNYTATGPVLQGFKKPVNDLSRGCSVEDIVNVAAVTVLQSVES